MRADGRLPNQLRSVKITRNFTSTPAGSVLWTQGGTMVLVTASITPEVPPWFRDDKPGGWVTADYVMLPGSTPRRKDWPKIGHTDSRGTEIQRLIGRTIRASVDLSKIGPNTISLDCQVLQADGGTRTAAKLPEQLSRPRVTLDPNLPMPARFDPAYYHPRQALLAQLAAVSVGIVDGEVRLDLDYQDDSRATVDMNVAYTSRGQFVEIQGSAENAGGFDRKLTDQMLDLAVAGCEQLMRIQKSALESA